MQLPLAFGKLRLRMTIAQADEAFPGIKKDVLVAYNPAVNACIKAGCSGLQFYSYRSVRETGDLSATLIFRSDRLASFDWAEFRPFNREGAARDSALTERWRKNYGPPQKTEPDTAGSMIGEWWEWEDRYTRFSILHSSGAVGGLEVMIDDLAAEREMRQEVQNRNML
jgi:hypothetical protein